MKKISKVLLILNLVLWKVDSIIKILKSDGQTSKISRKILSKGSGFAKIWTQGDYFFDWFDWKFELNKNLDFGFLNLKFEIAMFIFPVIIKGHKSEKVLLIILQNWLRNLDSVLGIFCSFFIFSVIKQD